MPNVSNTFETVDFPDPIPPVIPTLKIIADNKAKNYGLYPVMKNDQPSLYLYIKKQAGSTLIRPVEIILINYAFAGAAALFN